MTRKTFLAGIAIFAVVAVILAGSVYAFAWFRWHHDIYLMRYIVVAAALPLLAAVVSGHRAYVVPGALLALGVLIFWFGVLGNGSGCQQPGKTAWQFVYRWHENTIYYGARGGFDDGYRCFIDLNAPITVFGYLLTGIGIAGLTLSDARSRINTGLWTLVERVRT